MEASDQSTTSQSPTAVTELREIWGRPRPRVIQKVERSYAHSGWNRTYMKSKNFYVKYNTSIPLNVIYRSIQCLFDVQRIILDTKMELGVEHLETYITFDKPKVIKNWNYFEIEGEEERIKPSYVNAMRCKDARMKIHRFIESHPNLINLEFSDANRIQKSRGRTLKRSEASPTIKDTSIVNGLEDWGYIGDKMREGDIKRVCRASRPASPPNIISEDICMKIEGNIQIPLSPFKESPAHYPKGQNLGEIGNDRSGGNKLLRDRIHKIDMEINILQEMLKFTSLILEEGSGILQLTGGIIQFRDPQH